MILALDVGNTNTVVGGFEDGVLRFSLRMQSDRSKTLDEYVLLLRGLLADKGVDLSHVEGGILSSVVPELRYLLGKSMEVLTGKRFLVVSHKMDLGGMRILTDIPSQLGADLLVDAAAALSLFRPPLVIFDMGTATTMSVLDANGDYIGGVIVPGLRLSMDALSSRAAQLPFINMEEPPERLIGTNTVDCMKAGAIYSNAAMIDGLVDRVEEELGQPVTVAATGGLMGVVLPFCKHEIHYDKDLLLLGLWKLYERNK
ncbi:type III pantothenate kinase [Pseudoflavonifractor sp. MSJ-37]|uniref:type III pantothenate kinase n=1 Tax=Pseudoflavonifractor sp. MSJ-37 TaxID=2841531 RepID=UPI001C112798|nr:type III pantothenate kinase [Pseudoflavonifractor sp. MSJ-37]MBU5435291.1 type III pantothenate kinase [Pseudoflavonifractor sp. MSJ-37]